MIKFLVMILMLSLVWVSIALAESGHRYTPSLPAFHQPLELWKIRHGQNMVRPGQRWGGAPLAEARQACQSCHQPETCLDCHRGRGGPDFSQSPLENSSINLLIADERNEIISGGQWSDCLRCHPLEAAWPGGLDLIQDPGEYLPVNDTFSCPAVQLLGRQMSLMNLSLKRAEYLVDPELVSPFKAEASRWESLLSSPLVLTRAENIVLGMQNLERLAENKLSRPALAAGERLYLLVLVGPFLGFGLMLAWRSGCSAKNQTVKNARMYTCLSFVFLSLSLGIGAGLLFGPDDFFYPALADDLGPKPAEEAGGAFQDEGLDRLFLLAELIESWIKTQPSHDEPTQALALAYQGIKQQLSLEAPDYLQGPPWPGSLATWALIAKSSAAIKYGPTPADHGLNPGVEVWDDQIKWLFSLPDSPLRRKAALIMVKALAEIRPRPTEARVLIFPVIPAEEPGIISFGSAVRQSSTQLMLNRLLSLLSEPEELAAGLLAAGQGLAKAGFQAEAVRVFGRVYETALYIKDQQSQVSIFLALYQSWSDLDKSAGLQVLTETLTLAAAIDSEKEKFNHWSAGRSLAKVARLWSRINLLEALTMANDLRGDHEAWLTIRAASLMALGTDLEASALNQQHNLNLKPVYQDYALYLQSFDLKSPRYSSAWLSPSDLAADDRLSKKAYLDAEQRSDSEELEFLARSGKLALQAKDLWKKGHSEDALAAWREAWEITQVVGDSYQHNLEAARLYQALGDSVADEQPEWAALAYQKAIRLATTLTEAKSQ